MRWSNARLQSTARGEAGLSTSSIAPSSACRACPRLVAGARRSRAKRSRASASETTGAAPSPASATRRAHPRRRPRPRRPRREPHRPRLHRGPLRRLPLCRLASRGPRQPAHQHLARRRAQARRRVHRHPRPLRPAGQQAPPRRDRALRPLPRRGAGAPARASRVIVALGAIAWRALLDHHVAPGGALARPRPGFRPRRPGGARPRWLLGSYHVSQQNTQTGRLTVAMFDRMLAEARQRREGTG